MYYLFIRKKYLYRDKTKKELKQTHDEKSGPESTANSKETGDEVSEGDKPVTRSQTEQEQGNNKAVSNAKIYPHLSQFYGPKTKGVT